MNRDCEIRLNESGVKCNLDVMICKHVQMTQQQGVTTTTTATQQQQNTNSGPSAVDTSAAMAMYEILREIRFSAAVIFKRLPKIACRAR